MDQNEQSTPAEDFEANSAAGRAASSPIGAGRMVAEAREKAGISAAKLCADLRISASTLEALEAGEYEKLAGAPYVRAMLVTLSRYLHLDSHELLKAYADDAGSQEPATTTVSPYKDDSGTHAKAHKQIFILLLAVLLFILLLIMGKVNTSSPEPEPEQPPAAADTLLNIEPQVDSLPADSLSDSSVTTDSLNVSSPSPDPEGLSQEDKDATSETRVRVVALSDSIWLRILPAGERESSLYLRFDKPVDFNHDDAITFITRKGGTVRVIAGDSEVIPSQRRFKVDGTQITN